MRHIEGENRQQTTLLPESLDDFVPVDHPVRVIDAYVDSLDTKALGFDKAVTKETGRNQCPLQANCTRSDTRTITRHFHEAAIERSQARVKADPSAMGQRMAIVERPFAVLKQAMALRRFNCKGMTGAKTEMAIAVLGNNLNRMISRLGVPRMLEMIA